METTNRTANEDGTAIAVGHVDAPTAHFISDGEDDPQNDVKPAMAQNPTVQPVAVSENLTDQPAITENSPDQPATAEGNSIVEPNASVELNNGYASNVGLFVVSHLIFYFFIKLLKHTTQMYANCISSRHCMCI